MPNVSHIRDILYSLKRDYGEPVTLVQPHKEQTDSVTGQRTVDRTVFHLRRAAILPREMIRVVFYDLSFLKANNNFTLGGELDLVTMAILVDGRDLNLKGYREIGLTDSIYYKNERYEIEKAVQLNFNLGFALALKTVQGQPPYQPISIHVQQSVYPYDGGSCEQA